MKAILILSILPLAATAQTNIFITFSNQFGVHSNVQVVRVTDVALVWRDTNSGNGGSVKLADLPEALQKRFNYDPAQVAEAEAKRMQEALARQMEAFSRQQKEEATREEQEKRRKEADAWAKRDWIKSEENAKDAIIERCRDITGFRRVVNVTANVFSSNTNDWTGSADVEFFNKAGGVARTNVDFRLAPLSEVPNAIFAWPKDYKSFWLLNRAE